jgi:hypothetical protein
VWPNRIVRTSTTPLAPLARAFTFAFIVLIIAYAGTDDTLYMWPWILLALARAARLLAEREYRLMLRPVGRPDAAFEAAGVGARLPAPDGDGAYGR